MPRAQKPPLLQLGVVVLDRAYFLILDLTCSCRKYISESKPI